MTPGHLRWSTASSFFALLIGSATAQTAPKDFRAIRPIERIRGVIDDSRSITRPGNRHPLARAEFDRGMAPADTRMDRMVMVLQPDRSQQEAVEELLAAQQDPRSAEYQRWLTPEDFGQRFGVAENDLRLIMDWLNARGFQVEAPPPSRLQLVFSGTVAQVQSAFGTEVHIYRVGGQSHYANAAEPRIPEALAEVVVGVLSMHDFHSQPMHLTSGLAASPQFTSNTTHYLAAADFATIYDVSALYTQAIDGSGQSIAVAGRSNINLGDVQSFRSRFGLPPNNPNVILNGSDPGVIAGGEQGEATLDVEWAGATAPKATVQFVLSASTSSSDGVALSSQYIVNHNLAPVLTLSFGSCEAAIGTAGNQFWNSVWQQAAAQGIIVLVSSGDSGAAGCDDPSSSSASGGAGVNALCSSPFSTCVGGTQLSDTANPNAYLERELESHHLRLRAGLHPRNGVEPERGYFRRMATLGGRRREEPGVHETFLAIRAGRSGRRPPGRSRRSAYGIDT